MKKRLFFQVSLLLAVSHCHSAEDVYMGDLSLVVHSPAIDIPGSPSKAGYNINPFVVGSEHEEISRDPFRGGSQQNSFKPTLVVGSPFEQPVVVPPYTRRRGEEEASPSRQQSVEQSVDMSDYEAEELVEKIMKSPKAREALTVFLLTTQSFKELIDREVKKRLKESSPERTSSDDEFGEVDPLFA